MGKRIELATVYRPGRKPSPASATVAAKPASAKSATPAKKARKSTPAKPATGRPMPAAGAKAGTLGVAKGSALPALSDVPTLSRSQLEAMTVAYIVLKDKMRKAKTRHMAAWRARKKGKTK